MKRRERFSPIFRLEPAVSGTIPTAGLLVCNHLSYLDIVLLAGVAPAVFVAKSEVARWPVFGWFARKGGTIFVQRERRAQTGEANDEIAEALAAGALVVLFPEGTSSGGERVLPFKSSLLEAAARTKRPIYAGLVRYELDDGDVAEEVCYWRDHVLGPHLLNLMSKKSVRGKFILHGCGGRARSGRSWRGSCTWKCLRAGGSGDRAKPARGRAKCCEPIAASVWKVRDDDDVATGHCFGTYSRHRSSANMGCLCRACCGCQSQEGALARPPMWLTLGEPRGVAFVAESQN